MIVEFFVLVQVEIANHAVKVFRFELSEPVFSLELAKLLSVNKANICAIYAFKGSVGFELSHGAKYLSQFLNLDLLFGGVNKHVF